MDSITSSPVVGSLGHTGLTKKTPPKAAPQVTGGHSSWLESGVSLLKAGAVFYLLRCTGAQPTPTQTPSGTLLPDSVAQYESAEDLVRELASSVGIDHFHVSNAQPYDGWRYKLLRYTGVRQAARGPWGDPPGDKPMTVAVEYQAVS